MKILGVRIDNFSKEEILDKVETFLEKDNFQQIVTVNPEFILRAQDDAKFRDILNSSQLCLADGVGIWFAHLFHGKILKARITGADFIHDILKIAQQKKIPVFLVNNNSGLSTWEEIRRAALKIYPDLVIDGADMDKNSSLENPLNDKYKILFCNFGAPQQEIFIHSLKSAGKSSVRLAIGVGGGFDFLTHKVARAPKIFQKMGLEWLWRLFQQPRYRAARIFQAVVVFPLKVIF